MPYTGKSRVQKCKHPKDKIYKSSFNGYYCGECGQKVEIKK